MTEKHFEVKQSYIHHLIFFTYFKTDTPFNISYLFQTDTPYIYIKLTSKLKQIKNCR